MQQSHPDIHRAPIHQAAQSGSFNCIKMFMRHGSTCIIARDGYHQTPDNIALRCRNLTCWGLLIAAHFSYTKICGFTLITYSKIMKWCTNAKERVSQFKGVPYKFILLPSKFGRRNNTFLGNALCVNGYNMCNKNGIRNERCNSVSLKKINKVSTKQILPIIQSPKMTPKVENRQSQSILRINFKKKGVDARLLPPGNMNYKRFEKIKLSAFQIQMKTESGKKTIKCGQGYSICDDSNTPLERKRTISRKKSRKSEIKELVCKATGFNSHDLATKCLEFGQVFDKKKWRTQLNIALKCCSNTIERGEFSQFQPFESH